MKIQIDLEYGEKEYHHLEDIEQHFLVDIKADTTELEAETEMTKFLEEVESFGKLLRCIGKIDDKFIFKSNRISRYGSSNYKYYIVPVVAEINDLFFYDNNKMDKILLNAEEIKELRGNTDKFNSGEIKIELEKIEILDKKSIEEAMKKAIEEREIAEEKQRQEQLEEERKEKEAKDNWKSLGEFSNERVIIKENIIKNANSNEQIEAEEKIRNLFTWDKLGRWADLEDYENMIFNLQQPYKYKRDEVEYSIAFNPLRINDKPISQERFKSSVQKLKWKQDITAVLNKNKMPQIYYDFLKVTYIEYHDSVAREINIPFKIVVKDEKKRLFDVEFLGSNKVIDWEFVRKYFVNGMSIRRYLTYEELIKFFNEFGFDKQYALEKLRRARTLKQLKGSN